MTRSSPRKWIQPHRFGFAHFFDQGFCHALLTARDEDLGETLE